MQKKSYRIAAQAQAIFGSTSAPLSVDRVEKCLRVKQTNTRLRRIMAEDVFDSHTSASIMDAIAFSTEFHAKLFNELTASCNKQDILDNIKQLANLAP